MSNSSWYATALLKPLDAAPVVVSGSPGLLQLGGPLASGTGWHKIVFMPIDPYCPGQTMRDFMSETEARDIFRHLANEHQPSQPPISLQKLRPNAQLNVEYIEMTIPTPLGPVVIKVPKSRAKDRRASWYTAALMNPLQSAEIQIHGVKGLLLLGGGVWHKIVWVPMDPYWEPFRIRDLFRNRSANEFDRFRQMLS